MSAIASTLFLNVDWLGENNSKKYPDWVGNIQIIIANTNYTSIIPPIDSPLVALQLDFYETKEETFKLSVGKIKQIVVKLEHFQAKEKKIETINVACPFEPVAGQHYRLQLQLKQQEVIVKLVQLTPDQMVVYHLLYDELQPRTETFLKNIGTHSSEAMEAFGEALKAEVKKIDADILKKLAKKQKINDCLKAIKAEELENAMNPYLKENAKSYSQSLWGK